MLTFAEGRSIELRDYQSSAIDALREHIRAKILRLILCAGTGAGKTLTSAKMIKDADAKGSYVLFIVDRVALVNQTSAVFDEYGISHGVVQADHPRWSPFENVQVCSAQTLGKRTLPRDPKLIVVDECHCFPAGTLVSTPTGPTPIEQINVGDTVYAATGLGYVRHTFRRDAAELVRLTFDDGSQVECTPDHRFLTADAWREARLMDGQSAFGIEDMPRLWLGLSAEDHPEPQGVVGSRSGELLAPPRHLLSALCEEIEEPHAYAGSEGEARGDAARDGTCSAGSGRQRPWAHRAAAAAVASAWAGVDSRAHSSDEAAARQRVADALQAGSGERGGEGGYRTGRTQSLLAEDPGAGPEEGRLPQGKRVVSVEAFQRGGAAPVFNIEVSGHPSYFANGVLVHNCQHKTTLALMARYPDAVKIGLTATPFTPGMAEHWDGMVNVIPTRALINEGYLVEPKIYVAKSPDDSEFGRNSFGEFSDESAASAGIRIVGDVVAEWVGKTQEHFGGPVKTIVFSPTVEHGRELCAAFAAAGFNFQQISYLDKDDAERADKIAEFRRPDSLIHGLVSCGVLTKGFDVPDVRVGISCKPYRKSLSSHIQEIGRIMRPIPGEVKHALWLDHSGNIERFAVDMYDVWENGAGELSHAQKRDSTPRERSEQTREKVVCPECRGALRGNTCMSCGWERPARSNIHAGEGELYEFDLAAMGAEARAGLRADCLRHPRKVWEAALHFCALSSRGGEVAARRWAYGIYRGVYPNSKLPFGWYDMAIPALADPSAVSLIEREVKRFRKRSPPRSPLRAAELEGAPA